MKISAFKTISWAVLILRCVGAAAQDAKREMGSVDVSVHAGVEEQSRVPEGSQGSAKPSTTFSSWSAQPAKQPGTTAGWSAMAASASPAGTGAASKPRFRTFQPQTQGAFLAPEASGLASYSASRSAGKLRKPTSAAGTLSGEKIHRSSILSEPRVPAPPSGVPFEIQGFPSSFKKGKSRLTDNFARVDPFPGKGFKAKQRKPRLPRSMDFSVADPMKSTTNAKH